MVCSITFGLVLTSLIGFELQLAASETGDSPSNFSTTVPYGLFPFGAAEGDQFGPRGDDSATDPVILDIPFTFVGEEYTEIIVNSNGILSFDDRFTEYRQTPFPIDSPPLIALFWDDFNPTSGGQISYRLTNDSDELLLLHRLLLCVDIEDIDEDFYPEQIFIATWDRVRPYTNSPAINSETENTLQVLLATDGLQTIAVFIYDDIQWGAGAQIGFNAGDGYTYYMLPEALTSLTLNMSERSNVDQPGVFVFRIDNLGMVECSASPDCSGPVVGNVTKFECCVENPSGRAFQQPDSGTCHVCIVFGWIEDEFTGEERESSYAMPVGYLKGAQAARENMVFDVRIQHGNPEDIMTLTGQIRVIFEDTSPQDVSVILRVDGISQEGREVVTFRLVPSLLTNLPDIPSAFIYFQDEIDVTIIDVDILDIVLHLNVFYSYEVYGYMQIFVCKSRAIGSNVEVLITPLTIDEAVLSGYMASTSLPPNPTFSPNRADLNDFSDMEMYLTFYWYYSVNCLPVYITIFNDDINEAYHQLFAIRLSLVSSQNPSMVVMSRNISMGIIIDDDPISIGFEQEQYTYIEPPSLRLFDISIIKENGRRSEQTFEVTVDVSSNMTNPYLPASPDEDYAHYLTRVIFPPDQESIAWSFGLVPNEDPEDIEAFIATISPNFTHFPPFATGGGRVFDEAVIIIQDNQSPVAFSQSVYTVHESQARLNISIFSYIFVALFDDLMVNFTTFDENATKGIDYEAVSMPIDLTGNQSTAVISIPILDDILAEGYEIIGGRLEVVSQSLNLSFTSIIKIEIIDDEVEGICGNMPSSGECSTDALCRVSTNGRSISDCVCREGFIGNGFICRDVDECSIGQHDCHVNAQCTNIPGGFKCNCNEGYFGNGTLCIDILSKLRGSRSTDNDNCTCFNESSSGLDHDDMCGCLPGFEIATTEQGNTLCQDINECSDDKSMCNGTCENTIGSYNCYCPSGYNLNSNGSLCVDIDECVLQIHDCDRNARCTNTIGNYTCTCMNNYFGDGFSCSRVEECNRRCQQRCISTDDTVACGCRPGYYLLFNDRDCADVNECEVYGNCDPNARCFNTLGSYKCQCREGFHGNGFICKDIDECDTGLHDCDKNAVCINTAGSFTCMCNDSLYGDGRLCNANGIDNTAGVGPIIESSGSHQTIQFDQQNNQYSYAIGSHFCLEDVDTVLQGVSVTCPLANEPSPPPQFNMIATRILINNTSENLLSSLTMSLLLNNSLLSLLFDDDTWLFRIDCFVSNSFGSSTNFSYIRVCDPNECQEGITNNCSQICTRNVSLSGVSSYECSCYEGYSQNNTDPNLCEDINECLNTSTHNCSEANNEECLNFEGYYACRCQAGFERIETSQTCEDIDECAVMFTEKAVHNCSEKETCFNSPPGSFSCQCITGYERASPGMSCEDINECADNTSHTCNGSNHRKCVNILGSYYCDCEPGFQDNDLDTICEDVNECLSESLNNCTHLCNNTEGSYLCSCQSGFVLDPTDNATCNDVNECDENTHVCHSNAMCINMPGGYDCTCKENYQGDGVNCEFSSTITSIISTVTVTSFVLMVGIVVGILLYVRYNKTRHRDYKGYNDVEHLFNRRSMVAVKGRNISVQTSFKLKLPPPLIIEASSIKIVESIGEGEFGIVYRGQLKKVVRGTTCVEIVAVKTLKGFYDSNAVKELLKECSKMYKFDHPNVLSLIGVCLDGGTAPYIIVPFMANGSLLAHLKSNRKKLVISAEETDQEDIDVICKRLADMCIQIAKGMSYLASMKVVHRDLAARNCMIDINMVIKVADFGLSESVGTKEYFRQDKDAAIRLPIKWLAPESMEDYVFSEKSDVWAYGITCWEVFSGGKVPYPSINVADLPTQLREGHRLARPSNSACNQEMYEIMLQCWEFEPQERPTFAAIVESLCHFLETMVDYMDIGGFSGSNGEGGYTESLTTGVELTDSKDNNTMFKNETFIELETIVENDKSETKI